MSDLTERVGSTRLPKPVPPEFRDVLVRHGWRRAEHLFGKNPAKRYAAELGVDRLVAERAAHLAATGSTVSESIPA